MKKLLIILLLAAAGRVVHAQVLGGVFSQNSTYLKNLATQLAALNMYKSYVQKGYKIAKTGLGTIEKFKGGEFNLHRFYFDSLKTVNPKVKLYSKVSQIMAMQAEVIYRCARSRREARDSKQFGENEIEYFGHQLDELLTSCDHTLDELLTLCTDKELQMRDDERISRIDLLWQEMCRKYRYACSFNGEISSQVANRRLEHARLEGTAAYYPTEL
ncbi:hypothetical protein SAMN05216464_113111 [Mucilaginibacter pineti]|uniref:Uncharacterized protein n=1 Tax=Mucilaginibacter pineti TaxID=1391627 RepID=A0A1G7IQK5_9SPHI|nr:hypothetical protein [Mucilaginibacter pineti]SDF14599.1 hypothetical protein SAMN05216464_113111 [Mucilaginibacter pineti]